ncbi:MAG: PEGA domain-containing protein [Phycisphaerae bacterium]|nr:PEGA domain-containing protein [Phycisphaerae bacterium]
MRKIIFSFLIAVIIISTGCKPNRYQRYITIKSNPSGAVVWLNDQEIGTTPVTTPFTWYGDYDVILRKDGYQSLHTNQKTKRPFTQWVGMDFFFEVIWPFSITDQQNFSFTLEPLANQNDEMLIEKAKKLQQDK